MHRHDQKENSRVDMTQLESVFLINYHFIFKGEHLLKIKLEFLHFIMNSNIK